MLAKLFMTYSRRRWAYACGETLALSISALCALALIAGRHWPIQIGELGFPFLAGCVMVLGLIAFIVLVIVREQDKKV